LKTGLVPNVEGLGYSQALLVQKDVGDDDIAPGPPQRVVLVRCRLLQDLLILRGMNHEFIKTEVSRTTSTAYATFLVLHKGFEDQDSM